MLPFGSVSFPISLTHGLHRPTACCANGRGSPGHGSDFALGSRTPRQDAFAPVARTDSLAQDIVVFILVD